MNHVTKFLVLAAMGLLAVLPASANGSLISNQNPHSVTVWFDCGVSCGNYFTIPSKGTAARPNEAGYVWLGVDTEFFAPGQLDTWVCQDSPEVKVPAHGEAVTVDVRLFTQGDRGEATWAVYNADDSPLKRVQARLTPTFHPDDTFCWEGTP
jgi:hypothetical protein